MDWPNSGKPPLHPPNEPPSNATGYATWIASCVSSAVPSADQVATSRDNRPTTLQALELSNGDIMHKAVQKRRREVGLQQKDSPTN